MTLHHGIKWRLIDGPNSHVERRRCARLIDLPRVADVVLRTRLHGCPVCGLAGKLTDRGTFCERCGVFRCPSCKLWRKFFDGGGDDPECNDCWVKLRTYRRVAVRRLARRMVQRKRAA